MPACGSNRHAQDLWQGGHTYWIPRTGEAEVYLVWVCSNSTTGWMWITQDYPTCGNQARQTCFYFQAQEEDAEWRFEQQQKERQRGRDTKARCCWHFVVAFTAMHGCVRACAYVHACKTTPQVWFLISDDVIVCAGVQVARGPELPLPGLSGTSLEWLLETLSQSSPGDPNLQLLSQLAARHWHRRRFLLGNIVALPLLGRRVLLEVRALGLLGLC